MRTTTAPRTVQCIPFTVVDESVHVLETASEPWGIQFELRYPRTLDETRLRDAVRLAVSRHPMARARQLPARGTDRTWCWEIPQAPDLDPVRVVDCPDDAALAEERDDFYSRPVPLVEAPPFRLLLVRRPGGTHLLLNANHAAFDGFGCVRLLQSVARAYAGQDDPDPAVPLDEARDLDHLLRAPGEAVRGRRLKMVAGKVTDLAARPARPAPDGGEDRPGYGFHHVALSEQQTSALADAAATLNDLLLTALHLALARWNDDHGRPAKRIGVLVPVNLRPKEWREDVVTNVVLDARVLTTPDDRTSAGRALEAVHAQTEAIKEGGGAAMIEVMGGWSSLPLWAKQPASSLLWLSGNRFVDTAILSNLGELKAPPDFGEDVGAAEEAWFSAPVRMPGGLCVGAATVKNRLCLTIRYRRSLLDRASAERFANLFLTELQQVAKS